MALAMVKDLRVARAPATAEGLEPADADAYFGKVLRSIAKGTRLARAQTIKTFFLFLELRHKVEIHQMTGRVVECPIDEMNRPRGGRLGKLRIPPTVDQVGRLFAGWRQELATCGSKSPSPSHRTTKRHDDLQHIDYKGQEWSYRANSASGTSPVPPVTSKAVAETSPVHDRRQPQVRSMSPTRPNQDPDGLCHTQSIKPQASLTPRSPTGSEPAGVLNQGL
ncbi:hypothetical protein AB0K48_06380 [Nonomuraea sp. NPDC055795]